MPTFDFADARLKLDRASEHVAEVKRAIVNLTSPDLYRLALHHHIETGEIEVRLDSLHSDDNYLSALIGDAIGNLRSTLDYLMAAIVRSLGGDPSNVTFPFANDQKGFEGQVKAASRCLTPSLISIFEKIEAYKQGAGHTLWVINRLRNIDKHRLLITIHQLAGVKADWKVGNSTFTDCEFGVRAGEAGSCIRAPAEGFEFTSDPIPVFKIQLHEPPIVQNSEVKIFLDQAFSAVDRLLCQFEQV